LTDRRSERTKREEVLDSVPIALGGIICGADNWLEIMEWGQAKEAWLRQCLALPNGIPSMIRLRIGLPV